MLVLLDTHTLIWFMEDDQKLSVEARNTIESPDNQKLVSIISFYEMAIKINIGKLKLGKPLESVYQDTIDNHIQVLPISKSHLFEYVRLPQMTDHKDPFDRMIIAAAIGEDATILTADPLFGLYEELVRIVW